MSCKVCQPLIEASRDDRERKELNDRFDILEEQTDKYDPGTMWWRGKAQCKACHQIVSFDYMAGSQNFGLLTPLP